MNYEIIEGERKGSSFLSLTNEKFLLRQKSKCGENGENRGCKKFL